MQGCVDDDRSLADNSVLSAEMQANQFAADGMFATVEI